MSTRALLIVISTSISLISLSAQNGTRYTEAEMEFQNEFLEAKSYDIISDEQEALEHLKRLYDQDRTRASVAFEMAKLYTKKEDLENAINYAKIAVERDQKNPYYKQYLAESYEKNYLFAEAASLYGTLLNQHSENRYYYEKMAYCQLASGTPLESIKTLNILEHKIGINESLTRRKYDIYRSVGDQVGAEKELLAIVKDQPEETRYLHNLAKFYESIEEKEKQLNVYTSILQIDPEDSIAALHTSADKIRDIPTKDYITALKEIFKNKNIELDAKLKKLIPLVKELQENYIAEKENLLELTDILIAVHPEEAPVYAIKGDIYNAFSDHKKAINNYKKTLELDDRVYTVWTQLMYTLLYDRSYEELAKYSEESLYIFPNQPLSYYMLAKAYIKTNKLKDAKDYISEGILISGKNIRMVIDFKLLSVEAYILEGNTEQATAILGKIESEKTNVSAAQYEAVGDMYAQLNLNKQARTSYRTAIEMGANNERINPKINKLDQQ